MKALRLSLASRCGFSVELDLVVVVSKLVDVEVGQLCNPCTDSVMIDTSSVSLPLQV